MKYLNMFSSLLLAAFLVTPAFSQCGLSEKKDVFAHSLKTAIDLDLLIMGTHCVRGRCEDIQTLLIGEGELELEHNGVYSGDLFYVAIGTPEPTKAYYRFELQRHNQDEICFAYSYLDVETERGYITKADETCQETCFPFNSAGNAGGSFRYMKEYNYSFSKGRTETWTLFTSFSFQARTSGTGSHQTDTPTSSPTAGIASAPTEAPTMSPISAPVDAPFTCRNNRDWSTTLSNGKQKGCGWVRAKPNRRCRLMGDDGLRGFEGCPRACGNDGKWVTEIGPTSNRREKGCSWVRRNPQKRCKKRGRDGRRAYVACAVVCCEYNHDRKGPNSSEKRIGGAGKVHFYEGEGEGYDEDDNFDEEEEEEDELLGEALLFAANDLELVSISLDP